MTLSLNPALATQLKDLYAQNSPQSLQALRSNTLPAPNAPLPHKDAHKSFLEPAQKTPSSFLLEKLPAKMKTNRELLLLAAQADCCGLFLQKLAAILHMCTYQIPQNAAHHSIGHPQEKNETPAARSFCLKKLHTLNHAPFVLWAQPQQHSFFPPHPLFLNCAAKLHKQNALP